VATKKLKMSPQRIEDAFDFSVDYVTVNEVALIHDALENNLIDIPFHASSAASDDALTLPQILNVIRVGFAISKDFPTSKNRQAGINFEGKAGGKRVIRVKVSWNLGYYVVTVHTVVKIKRKR
jgi:hypothetical protein